MFPSRFSCHGNPYRAAASWFHPRTSVCSPCAEQYDQRLKPGSACLLSDTERKEGVSAKISFWHCAIWHHIRADEHFLACRLHDGSGNKPDQTTQDRKDVGKVDWAFLA